MNSDWYCCIPVRVTECTQMQSILQTVSPDILHEVTEGVYGANY